MTAVTGGTHHGSGTNPCLVPYGKATTVDITSTDVKAVIAKTHLSDTSESDPLLSVFWVSL